MALLGELAVNLIARTKKFVKDMKGSIGSVDKFTAAVKKGDKFIQKWGVALSGAAAGLAFLTATSFDAAATNIRFAETLDLPVAKLEAYQKAASNVGVAQDQMNDALLELSRRSAEAATGTGSMFDTLQTLNIDVENFLALPLDRKFAKITGEINKLGNAAQRNFLTDEAFGGASDVISGLTGEINDMATALNESGFGTSQAAAERLKKTDAQIKELTATLKGISKQFIIDISEPALEAVKGLKVILDLAGGGTPTAKEQARQRAIELGQAPKSGPSFNEMRKATVAALGEVMAMGFDPANAARRFSNQRGVSMNAGQRAAQQPQDVAAIQDALGANRQIF